MCVCRLHHILYASLSRAGRPEYSRGVFTERPGCAQGRFCTISALCSRTTCMLLIFCSWRTLQTVFLSRHAGCFLSARRAYLHALCTPLCMPSCCAATGCCSVATGGVCVVHHCAFPALLLLCGQVPLYERGYEKDPAKVAAEAIRVAERDGRDVVLVDTAGRMQVGGGPARKSTATCLMPLACGGVQL